MKFKSFILLFFQLHFCFLVLNSVSGNKLRSHISTLYPEILNVTQRGIDRCYDGHLNGNQIPLFEQNQTGMALVRQYFLALPEHTPNNKTISNLMKSTHQIIAYVLNCSHTIAPNGTSHMKVGYTDLSVMSHDGIVHLTGSDYDLLEKDIDELLIYEGFSESVEPRPRAKRQVAPTWRRYHSGGHQAPSGLWNMYNVFFRPNSESHSKRNTIHMPVSPSGKGLGRCARLGPETDSNLPSSWDWRHYGVVPAVRNQITCGSCWAFVTTQQIEAAHLKAKKPRTWGEHLSPQQIVDHDNQAFGCEGGSSTTAYEYVRKNGLTDEASYPYVNRKNRVHHQRWNFPIRARISSYCIRGRVNMPTSAQENLDDEHIKAELIRHGPLFALIYGEGPVLQHYKSGIVETDNCPKETNHAVLLIGYEEDAWIFQNSWGTRWGEAGYFRVAMRSNMCGVNTQIAYAFV